MFSVYILFASLLLFLPLDTAGKPLVINDPDSSHELGKLLRYYPDTGNNSLYTVRSLPESAWEPVRIKHQPPESAPGATWLVLDIENNTKSRDWHIVSEYSFMDRVSLYYFNANNELMIQESGDTIPVSKRTIKHRLPVLPLQLDPGENRIWIRLKSDIGKMLDFTLEPPHELANRDTLLRNPFPEFIRLAVIIAIISILSAVYLKNTLFLWYLAYLLSICVYMGIWEGYALLYLYPENPGWNDHYHFCAGFLFGFFLIMFWKRFLSLSVQLPWYNRIMKVLAWTTFLFAIYALTPFSDFYILIILAIATTLAIIIITLMSNFRIIFMKQRYALYALLSSFSIIVSYSIYIFAGIPFIPGDDYTGNPLYLGFSIELVVLILSLLSRVRFNNELINGRATTTGLSNRTHSRIKHFDLRNLVSTLDKLMKEEKLYCDEDISLKRLADRLSISRHQLSELIKDVYKTNFYGYINDWRIREAKRLLVHEKERTILSIALDVGYNSKSTFNQSFKKSTGVTPTEFRNLNSED